MQPTERCAYTARGLSIEVPTWSRLDNAALVFPAVAGRRHTTIFRISATLTSPVELGRLERALSTIARRTPYFQVQLRSGLFWYFFESNRAPLRVMADSRNPCLDFPIRGSGRYPYRVRAYGRRIALEVSHIVTDGTGALQFLRSLLCEYLNAEDRSDVLDPAAEPDPGEWIDSFDEYYRPDVPAPSRIERAWQAPLPLSRRAYHVTTGRMPVTVLCDTAECFGVKLTPFLVGVHLYALAAVQRERGGRNSPIRVLVPVNMRQFFPSKTMHNFFLHVDPEIDTRLGDYTLDEVVRSAARQMELALDPRRFARSLKRNIGSERHPILRLMPRALKDLILAWSYRHYGETLVSGSMSNLGIVGLPESIADNVEHFDFIPPPSPVTRTNCGVVSCRGRVSISWGSLSSDRVIERTFFRTLVELGCPVEVEGNNQDWS